MRAGRKLLALIAFGAALPFSGCGDKEPEQAKAFAALLQSRILDRPGVHIPLLNDEEREKIGHYADDLAILKGFNDDLTAAALEFGKAMHPAPQNVMPLDLPKYRADFIAARDFFPHAAAGVDSALAKAEASRAKLHQPEAVKAKFDAAYEQLVTRPANALRDVVPLAAPTMEAEIRIADFIDAHKADLKAAGGQLITSKPALRKSLDALMADYAAKFAKVQEARKKLELAVEGH
jgi:hypothetical protein